MTFEDLTLYFSLLLTASHFHTPCPFKMSFVYFFFTYKLTSFLCFSSRWRNKLADDLKRSEPRASRATIDILDLENEKESDTRCILPLQQFAFTVMIVVVTSRDCFKCGSHYT
jgi:hypothetical protein